MPVRDAGETAENGRFWARFSGRPAVAGTHVLDVGCGEGRLCVELALAGAAQVIGADVNDEYLAHARANLAANFPELQGIVAYSAGPLEALPDNAFDYIVSKDAFEHIVRPDAVLAEMKRCLKPGGRIYIGFGPLYNSPDGHHGALGPLFPWGQLILPEATLVRRGNRHRGLAASSIQELELNQISFAAYRSLFYNCGLTVESFRVNQSRHVLSGLLSLLRKVPFLEEYCTHNIYTVLRKDE